MVFNALGCTSLKRKIFILLIQLLVVHVPFWCTIRLSQYYDYTPPRNMIQAHGFNNSLLQYSNWLIFFLRKKWIKKQNFKNLFYLFPLWLVVDILYMGKVVGINYRQFYWWRWQWTFWPTLSLGSGLIFLFMTIEICEFWSLIILLSLIVMPCCWYYCSIIFNSWFFFNCLYFSSSSFNFCILS